VDQIFQESLSEKNAVLVLRNMNYARKLARQFYYSRKNLGIEMEEFESTALLGLCDAARRYDPSKGIHFQTFCYFRIRGSMYDLLRRGGWVPRKHFHQLIESSEKSSGKNDTTGSADEEVLDGEDDEMFPYTFARNSGELANLAVIIEQIGVRIHVSKDWDTPEISYSEQLSPEALSALASTRRFLSRLIEQLPAPERRMIELRYFWGRSFDEMREQFDGASRSWLSRLHLRALDNLRDLILSESRQCSERMANCAL